MKTYKVIRRHLSPPREGDRTDVLEVHAEDHEGAVEVAFHQLEGKNGTYGSQEVHA